MRFTKGFISALLLVSMALTSCGKEAGNVSESSVQPDLSEEISYSGESGESSEDIVLKLIPFGEGVGNSRYLSAAELGYWENAGDIHSGNPWGKVSLPEALPVYKIDRIDGEKLKSDIEDLAELFGVDADGEPLIQASNTSAASAVLIGSIGDVYVHMSGEADHFSILFRYKTENDTFPSGEFVFDNSSYEAASGAVAAFSAKYAERLLNTTELNCHIEADGRLNLQDEPRYEISIYTDDEDAAQKLLNYRFNKVTWHVDDMRSVGIVTGTIDFYTADYFETYGNYPILAQSEAETLLLEGKCYTASDKINEAFVISKDAIKKVELVYNKRNDLSDTMFMPFYCFWLELPDDFEAGTFEQVEGVGRYYAFYVPAIDSKYILINGALKAFGKQK